MSKLQEFQWVHTRLKSELKQIDEKLAFILSVPCLKNSSAMIELQVERLKLLDRLRYLRPCHSKDIAYRKEIFETFPQWAENNIPENMHLVFHGTTLANTERIIRSGDITSGKDRWSTYTSGDNNGEISVSTKDFLEISMQYHMDFIDENDYEYYLPSGCLFVLRASPKEYTKAKKDYRTVNMYFKKNSNQLFAIVTTPENLKRVRWWMKKNSLPSDKVCDFKDFQEKIKGYEYLPFLSNLYQKN